MFPLLLPGQFSTERDVFSLARLRLVSAEVVFWEARLFAPDRASKGSRRTSGAVPLIREILALGDSVARPGLEHALRVATAMEVGVCEGKVLAA